MKKARRTLALLLAAALFLTTGSSVMAESSAQGKQQSASAVSAEAKEMVENADYVEDQVLVVFRDDVSDARIKKEIKAEDAQCLEITDSAQDVKVAVADIGSDSVEEAITRLEENPKVQYAQPNYKYKPASVNDPYANDEGVNQWYLTNTKAYQAWEALKTEKDGLSEVIVAVIDTGIDRNHEDLKANISSSSVKLDESGSPVTLQGDSDNHGTHTAGIIGATANNGKGIAGIASAGTENKIKIMAIDATANYSGELYFDTYKVVAAIEYAVTNKAKVINMSFAGGMWDYIMEDAVASAYQSGVTMVAAAGNEGTDSVSTPSDYGEVISVTALTRQNKRMNSVSGASNYGLEKDIAAPGTSILSTVPGGYEQMSGTSMSAPMVSAVAALLYAIDEDIQPSQVKNILCGTADYLGEDPGDSYSGDRKFDYYTGYGILDVEKAVKAAMESNSSSVENIYFKEAANNIDQGQSRMLETRVEPANAVADLKWETSDKDIATVDSTGKVTGRTGGTVTITCTDERTGQSAQCQVGINPVVEPESLKIVNGQKAASMTIGSSFYLDAQVLPRNAKNNEVCFKSSNTTVATVDSDGMIEARGLGTCKILAYTYNSKDKSFGVDGGNPLAKEVEVNVTHAAATGLKLTSYQQKIKLGDSVTFKAAVTPANADQTQPITWSSSNRSVAKVDQKTGTITTVGLGRTTIKASTKDGLLASLRITVFKTGYSGKTYGLKASSGSYDSGRLTWNGAVPDADGYEIWRAQGKKGSYAKVKTVAGTKTTWKDKSLKTGKKYRYKIRAYYKAGDKTEYCGYSKVRSLTPKLQKASVKAKAGKSKITVSWKKVKGATGYVVYKYSPSKEKYVKKKTIRTKKTKKRSYKDTSVKWRREYKYKVRSYRTVDGKRIYSPYSKAVSCTYR